MTTKQSPLNRALDRRLGLLSIMFLGALLLVPGK